MLIVPETLQQTNVLIKDSRELLHDCYQQETAIQAQLASSRKLIAESHALLRATTI